MCTTGDDSNPSLEASIPALECLCPDTKDSGHSFADSCQLDPATNTTICDCQEGYAGTNCDSCKDNYFGDPEISGRNKISFHQF